MAKLAFWFTIRYIVIDSSATVLPTSVQCHLNMGMTSMTENNVSGRDIDDFCDFNLYFAFMVNVGRVQSFNTNYICNSADKRSLSVTFYICCVLDGRGWTEPWYNGMTGLGLGPGSALMDMGWAGLGPLPTANTGRQHLLIHVQLGNNFSNQ